MGRTRLFTAALPLALLLGAAAARAQLSDLGAEQLVECLSLGDCGQDDAFGSALASGDFDDDGFADVAVGVPGEKVGTHPGAGSVHVFYGGRGGLAMAVGSDQIFDQSTSGVAGGPEDFDEFGAALATGDFDGDGIDDLAVGVPGEDLGTLEDAGTVLILFGSASGLTATGSLSISQDTFTSSESAEAGDRFGSSLAAGPQGFAFDVLAVGVPGEDLGVLDTNEGQVDILSSVGGVPLQGLAIRQQVDACDSGGLSEGGDKFGTTLGFRRKGSSGEWMAGTPLEDLHGLDAAGCVDLIGSNVCWSEDSTIAGSQSLDAFGLAVTSGDFDGDGHQDMGVGAPGRFGDGRVWALYANSAGVIDNAGFEEIGQFQFPDSDTEADSYFGTALASGDFDGDGFDDLAMSAPYRTISSHDNAGEVNVLYGNTDGLVPVTHQQTFNESFPAGMPGTPQGNGTFGYALAGGDFDGNGIADLAIGAPGEDFSSFVETGTVTVLYGLDRSTGAFGTVAFGAVALTVPEPESNTPVTVAIGRAQSAVVAASVDYTLGSGTATAGSDFTFTPGTASWPAGSLTPAKTFTVTILPDTLDEGDETIKLQLANPTAGTALGSAKTFTITIQDDDEGGKLKFHQSAFSVGEGGGMATIQVDRTGGAASNVTVHYATSNGTASAGTDYTAASGTLTFAAGLASASFQVPITQDGHAEIDETVTLTLSAAGGGGVIVSPSVATLTIFDDELILHNDGFESGLGNWSGHS